MGVTAKGQPYMMSKVEGHYCEPIDASKLDTSNEEFASVYV